MTFDEIVDLYESNPVAFLEGILPELFAYPVKDDPYCDSCRLWGKLTHQEILLTRENHKSENMGGIPRPRHRFSTNIVYWPLCRLSREQLEEQIRNFERKGRDPGLLQLYLREKFEPSRRVGRDIL